MKRTYFEFEKEICLFQHWFDDTFFVQRLSFIFKHLLPNVNISNDFHCRKNKNPSIQPKIVKQKKNFIHFGDM